jgi:hypothetical protein
LLRFIASIKPGQQPQACHNELLTHWEKQYRDSEHKAQWKQPQQVQRRGSHGPDNEDKQEKYKCYRKQRGNDDFAIAQSSAGGQQLCDDPPNGPEHNYRAEEGHGVEQLSGVDSD